MRDSVIHGFEPPPPRTREQLVAAMEVGAFLFFPEANLRSLRTLVSIVRRTHPEHKFVVAPAQHNGRDGVKVWRTA